MKSKKLVIVGDSAFAEIAYEYFTHDSDYEVVGFSVETEFKKTDTLFGLPVVAFEDIEQVFIPAEHDIFVAIVYTQLNRLRARLCASVKEKGYGLASYISTKAFVWSNVQMGEHCFIFEDNTVQPFVKLGDNVILWSGNHIGHHSEIGDHCFISSHVVISGFVSVGANSFLGVNSTISNNVNIGRDCWVGPSVTITKNVSDGVLFKGRQGEPVSVTTYRFFKLEQG